jgi:hypothetical protein
MPYSLASAVLLNAGWNTAARLHRGNPVLVGGVTTAYHGPGDVSGVGAATAAWGLRAFTAAIAAAGTQVLVNLRRDSDNATVDILVASSGGLGLTTNAAGGAVNGVSVSVFKGSANLFIPKIYDQSGNGFDMTQANAAIQPALILSVLGSLPVMRFSGAPQYLTMAGTLTQAQPFTVSVVASRTGRIGSQGAAVGSSSANGLSGFSGTNLGFMYAGSAATTSVADSTFHALQYVFNGASSDLNVNGSSNTVNPGTGNLSAVNMYFGDDSGSNIFAGDIYEGMLFSSAFSPTTSSSLSANQRAWCGF